MSGDTDTKYMTRLVSSIESFVVGLSAAIELIRPMSESYPHLKFHESSKHRRGWNPKKQRRQSQ